jgi:serine/threonine-protein kinase
LLVERRVLTEEELRRYGTERDDFLRRGTRVTLAQFLVRDRRLEASHLAALESEIEVRGRACFTCRRAYLVAPGGPATCPACGARSLLPPVVGPSTSGRFPLPQIPAADVYSASGRFPLPQSLLSAAGSSARVPEARPPEPQASPQKGPQIPIASTVAGSGSAPALGTVQPPAELGKTFGSYEILAELGRGGMGVVYKARPRDRDEVVALKVLIAGEFASPKLVARFRDEAKMVQKLDHPGIVPVYDAGEVSGLPYFTMKFIEGTLFEDMLAKGRGVSARKGAEILREVALAAQNAHEHGVIHRDLKPSNIIIETASERPFVMDFGLAKDLDDQKHLTRSGVAIGTPHYMPPEQAQGRHRDVDARTDVYAIGAMLYEVLAKRTPFAASTQAEMIQKIVEEIPAPPSRFQPGVPAALETIALKCLRKKKEERYPSALELARDIERALSGRQIVARRAPLWAPLVRKLEENPKVAAGLAVAALVAVFATAYGIHVSSEAERVRVEAEEKARKEEAERKARDAEEEKALARERRKAAFDTAIAAGRSQRLQARLAPTAPAARGLLEDAERSYTEALGSTEAGTDLAANAHYERALVRRDLARSGGLVALLDDLDAASSSKTYKARAHLTEGLVYLRREHDPKRARPELAVAKISPELGDASARLDEQMADRLAHAHLRFLDGDTQDAIGRAREAESPASELAPDASDAIAWFELTTAPTVGAARQGRLAREQVEKGLALDRWRPLLLLDRAWARALAGDLAAAALDLKTARLVAPDHPDAFAIDAWISAEKGLDESAKVALAAGAGLQPLASGFWDALEEKLSAVLEAAHTPDPAASPSGGGDGPTPRRSRVLYGDLPIGCDPKVVPRFDEVSALLQKHDDANAIALLTKIEADDPTHPEVCLYRARLLSDRMRYAEARALVEPALARAPESTFGLTLLGEIDAGEGKIDAAKADFEKALALAPGLRTPRLLLGRVLTGAHRFADVVPVLQPAHEADPDDTEIALLLVPALVESNRAGEAATIGRKVVDAEPGNLLARSYLTQALCRSGRAAEALDIATESERLSPGALVPLVDEAFALSFLGRAEESRAAFAKARAAAKDDAQRATVDKVEQQTKERTPPPK